MGAVSEAEYDVAVAVVAIVAGVADVVGETSVAAAAAAYGAVAFGSRPLGLVEPSAP